MSEASSDQVQQRPADDDPPSKPTTVQEQATEEILPKSADLIPSVQLDQFEGPDVSRQSTECAARPLASPGSTSRSRSRSASPLSDSQTVLSPMESGPCTTTCIDDDDDVRKDEGPSPEIRTEGKIPCDITNLDKDLNLVKLPDLLADTLEASPPEPRPPSRAEMPSEYQLKWVTWKGNKTPIITQNENGPCPLIAICNVLILKGKIRLPLAAEYVAAEKLMQYLVDAILNSLPKNISSEVQLNYEQNISDAMSILPKLQTGLDVNVRFTSVSSFEFTPELIVFDLLSIPLYHGWLVDPDSLEQVSAVSNCSYNQLVDKIINNKTSDRPELVTEALIGESFLESTASQLTYPGLTELNSTVKEDEPSVMFRNNHFITLYKQKNELYQLVTDQGFVNESKVMWETLNNIEGDGEFVDSEFVMVPPKPDTAPMSLEDRKIQEDQDYLLALSLQEESKKEAEQLREWEQYKTSTGIESLTDEQLAARLQAEEDAQTAALVAQQQQQHQLQKQHHPQQFASPPAPANMVDRPQSKMSNTSGGSSRSRLTPAPSSPVDLPPCSHGGAGDGSSRRPPQRHESSDSDERRGGKKQSCIVM